MYPPTLRRAHVSCTARAPRPDSAPLQPARRGGQDTLHAAETRHGQLADAPARPAAAAWQLSRPPRGASRRVNACLVHPHPILLSPRRFSASPDPPHPTTTARRPPARAPLRARANLPQSPARGPPARAQLRPRARPSPPARGTVARGAAARPSRPAPRGAPHRVRPAPSRGSGRAPARHAAARSSMWACGSIYQLGRGHDAPGVRSCELTALPCSPSPTPPPLADHVCLLDTRPAESSGLRCLLAAPRVYLMYVSASTLVVALLLIRGLFFSFACHPCLHTVPPVDSTAVRILVQTRSTDYCAYCRCGTPQDCVL